MCASFSLEPRVLSQEQYDSLPVSQRHDWTATTVAEVQILRWSRYMRMYEVFIGIAMILLLPLIIIITTTRSGPLTATWTEVGCYAGALIVILAVMVAILRARTMRKRAALSEDNTVVYVYQSARTSLPVAPAALPQAPLSVAAPAGNDNASSAKDPAFQKTNNQQPQPGDDHC